MDSDVTDRVPALGTSSAAESGLSPAAEPEPPRPTVRALLYGVAGVLFLCIATPYTDLVLRGSWLAHNCLPIGALCVFLLLVIGGNRLLRRLSRRWALTRAELLLIYTMMLTAAGIPSVGLAQPVIGLIVAPTYYASGSNDWAAKLHPLIPAWLRVADTEAARAFYQRAPAGQGVPWRLWVVPLAAWMVHAALLYAAFFFLVALLRRPWIDHERLSFALVQVPLEIVGHERPPAGNREFFRNPWTWAGILLPAFVHSINVLHTFYPSLPPAMTSPIAIGQGLIDRPWNALNDVRVYIHFSAIGLSYLLAGDVSLSLWVFWVISRAQLVGFSAGGFEGGDSASEVSFTPGWFVANQMWGALLAYGVWLVWDGYRTASRDWRSRRKAVSLHSGARRTGRLLNERQANSLPHGRGDGDISPSGAMAGFAASVLLLTFWCVAAGGHLWMQLGALLFWIATMLALTRLVCAGGLILIDTNWLPRDVIFRLLGRTAVRPGDLAVLTYHNTVFAWWPQLNMLPFMFNSMKTMDEERYRDRAVGWVMALAILVAIPASFAATLVFAYRHGALTLSEYRLGIMERGRLNELVNYVQTPVEPQWHTLFSLLLGGGAMLGMVALKRGVDWWPLSPLGYLVGSSGTVMDRLWFCIFVGWAMNALVRRYGGLREYMRFRPFFLGLILGEFATAAAWIAILTIARWLATNPADVPSYSVFP